MTTLATLWLYTVAVTLALCLALVAAFLCMCAVAAGFAVRDWWRDKQGRVVG